MITVTNIKVGDKVKCVEPNSKLTKGHIYTVSGTYSNPWSTFVRLEEKSPHDLFTAERFEIYEPSPRGRDFLEETMLIGIVYGILYDRIKDTDEALWIVAETIAEALGEVEDKL